MKDFFKPEDFKHLYAEMCKHVPFEMAATEIANAKLNAEIEKWPVVFGRPETESRAWARQKNSFDTHTARLAFIEEIRPKECQHTPGTDRGGLGHFCLGCGIKLRAKWEEVK